MALVRARVFLRCPFSQYSTHCSPAAPQVRAEGSLSPRAQDQPEQPSKTYPAKKKRGRGFLIPHLGVTAHVSSTQAHVTVAPVSWHLVSPL